MGLGDDIVAHVRGLKTPGQGMIAVILGFINCFLFGIGVIVAGALEGDVADIIIGVLQLVIPFVGWVWAMVWGVLMVIRGL